jgi:hypothetical protein
MDGHNWLPAMSRCELFGYFREMNFSHANPFWALNTSSVNVFQNAK